MHVLDEEYRLDIGHQDGSLPYRMQITYEDGGPSYHVNDYFPHFHYQAAAALAEEDYELVVEYWGNPEIDELAGLDTESELVEELARNGAVEDFPK